ncbi:MAG TPA: hypothetical protein VGJ29_06605 [Vicinamibacterales bacterium]
MTESKRPAIRLYEIAIIVSLLIVWATPARAQFKPRPMGDPTMGETYHVEGAIDLWFPTADLVITSGGSGALSGILGTPIDLKTDLGLTDQKFPAFHVQLRPTKRNKFRFQLIPINFTQTATLTRDVVFNGQKYSIGLPVASSLDWKAYRFGYEFDFISRDRGFAGFIVEAKYTDVAAMLTVPASGGRVAINEFDQARAPIPAIGGTGRFYIVPNISVTADITGFRLPDNVVKSASGQYVDVDIYGTMNFTNNVGVQGGYRSLDVGYAFKTDSGTFTLKGPYFGLVARF